MHLCCSTTGKHWAAHCAVLRRLVALVFRTQLASVATPSKTSVAAASASSASNALVDTDLLDAPPAVLRLFGATHAVDRWLRTLCDAGRMDALQHLNLHGCTTLSEDTLCAIVERTPRVRAGELQYVARCGARALTAIARHWCELEVLDVTSCAAIDDAALEAFVAAAGAQFAQDQHPLKYLNLANVGTISDRGLKAVGRYFAMHDLCLYGCYRVTDNGVLDLRVDSLRRFNFSGCYKVSNGCQRYLFTSNTNILFYNAPHQFGPRFRSDAEPLVKRR